MMPNSGQPALQETDTTDCSCMELYSRNNKFHQPARHSTLRSHQSHPRVNTCVKCRKRKPGNPKHPQHCPSCLCPPDVVRSSSGRLRGTENMEEVLSRFEEITRDPRELGPHQSSHARPIQQKNGPTKNNPKKSSSFTREQRKNEHDQMLNALYHDLMSSGLATEETQGSNKYQAPIKSVRKKSHPQTEHSPPPTGNPQAVDLDSDAVLRYFRDYKNLKGPTSNILLHKQDNVQQQRGDESRHEYADGTPRVQNSIGKDEQRRQFERDRHELNELDQEVREFEIKKGRENYEHDELWEKHSKTRPNEDGDQLERKVSFFPSKLPVPVYGNQSNRSKSPSGDRVEKCSVNHKVEGSISYHSTSIRDKNKNEEYHENLHRFDYCKESKDSLSQDLKDIPYCDVPYTCLSAPTTHPNKTEEHNVTGVPGILEGQEHCGQLPPVGPPKKYIYAGGDLDLHASKSYIVDLIDRALSRELGTVPEERKSEPVVHPSQSQKEMCVEIARALQGDCCLTYRKNSSVQNEAPDYVKHLKVLRWDYLNHIQDELKKLQDLERILDTYSPSQSLPVLQTTASSSEHTKDNRTIL